MKKLNSTIVSFLKEQGCVVVSTIDKNGFIHNSCKGIVEIDPEGKIYLLDLYQRKTLHNILNNPVVSVTAFDEYQFLGWCLKGKARPIPKEKIEKRLLKLWEGKISERITKRIIKNIQKQKVSGMHPEFFLPKPEYLLEVEVEEIVNLKPRNLFRR